MPLTVTSASTERISVVEVHQNTIVDTVTNDKVDGVYNSNRVFRIRKGTEIQSGHYQYLGGRMEFYTPDTTKLILDETDTMMVAASCWFLAEQNQKVRLELQQVPFIESKSHQAEINYTGSGEWQKLDFTFYGLPADYPFDVHCINMIIDCDGAYTDLVSQKQYSEPGIVTAYFDSLVFYNVSIEKESELSVEVILHDFEEQGGNFSCTINDNPIELVPDGASYYGFGKMQPYYYDGSGADSLFSEIVLYNEGLPIRKGLISTVAGVLDTTRSFIHHIYTKAIDAQISYCDFEPVIDGFPADYIWSETEPHFIGNIYPEAGTSLAAGYWKMTYSYDHLYVLIEIQDNKLFSSSEGSLTRGDRVTLLFDMLRLGAGKDMLYQTLEDGQVRLDLDWMSIDMEQSDGNIREPIFNWVDDSVFTFAQKTLDTNGDEVIEGFQDRTHQKTTYYELKIPFSLLHIDFTPFMWDEFGFNIIVSDNWLGYGPEGVSSWIEISTIDNVFMETGPVLLSELTAPTQMGIREKEKVQMTYLPTQKSIHIDNATDIRLFSIYNLTGAKLIEKHTIGSSYEYNLSSFKNGIYIITLTDNAGIITSHKILIR